MSHNQRDTAAHNTVYAALITLNLVIAANQYVMFCMVYYQQHQNVKTIKPTPQEMKTYTSQTYHSSVFNNIPLATLMRV